MTTETKIDIETLLPWGEVKRVTTGRGERNLRTAPATEAFWVIWRANKQVLKDAGLSCAPDRANSSLWVVNWWSSIDPAEVAAERAAEARSAELTPEQQARLQAITPKLLPYQVASVQRLVAALKVHRGALDASDTGTGKTFCALAAAVVLGQPVFVVCPKAVIPSWKRAAAHFGIRLAGIGNYELLRRGEQPVVRIDRVEGQKEKFVWRLAPETIIVGDEIHRAKDRKTLNSKMMMAALGQGYTVLGLSATAADNPMQMQFVGTLTKLFAGEKKCFPWMMRNGVVRGRFGLEFVGGRAVIDRIHQQIFPAHGSRLRIADLGDAFPETQISAEAYDINGGTEKINAIYEDMADEIARIEASEAEDKGACVLVARLRARQRTEVLKIPAIADMASDAVEEGMSVAIFVNFDDSADALMAKLKTKCCIRGGQTDADREAAIAAFQADREPVIICNIKAGGVGVSLHGSSKARTRFSIICPTDSGQDLKQALGRVWRAQGAKSIQRIFFAAGTIEEKEIMPNVQAKIQRIDTLNDGDLKVRGVSVPEPYRAPVKQVSVVIPRPEPDSPSLPLHLIALAHEGLRLLVAMDSDHASEQNDRGFAKFDVATGHSLAGRSQLTPNQGNLAARLCIKYKRQLGSDFVQPFYAALGLEKNA